MSKGKKKNCHNCKFGGYETDGDYGEYTYFVCEKREDDGYNNLEKNLDKPSYLEKAKVCCELRVDPITVICKECGDEDYAWEESKDGHVCFDCYIAKQLKESFHFE
jgi:hypothetical protein